jgi:hypothetical protein
MITIPWTLFAGVSGYSANAVRFDGTNDYLLRGAGLSGASDSKVGILSFWFQFQGGDGSDQAIFAGAATTVQIVKTTANKIRLILQNSGFAFGWDASTSTAYTADSTWHHFLASWNVGTSAGYIYVDDSSDLSEATNTDQDIEWTQSDWGIGSTTGAGNKLNCEIADFYLNIATSLDLSSTANRRKFIDANDKPVDLGSDGSTPTDAAPLIFLANPTASWQTNLGSGGGFTENGALTSAADSPSD